MRIGGVGARPSPSSDIASALSGAAAALGQRPAITSLLPDGRQEQGFVSLAGWVAKGAHLLRDEFGYGPGDRLGVAAPLGWPLAVVTLSAWWLGAVVVPAATPDLRLRVRHVSQPGSVDDTTGDATVLWIGDAPDGAGDPPTPGDECWTDAVIPYPDRAPTPARGALLPVTGASGRAQGLTQEELLASLADDADGVLGMVRDGAEDVVARGDAVDVLAGLVLRPLVTGAASVVVMAGRTDLEQVAAAERIARWR
jgi:uncharacterized protein (TIGR03089 family)